MNLIKRHIVKNPKYTFGTINLKINYVVPIENLSNKLFGQCVFYFLFGTTVTFCY